MDVEKPASKGHGLFGLFDWGKKSKKRLFSGGGSSPQVARSTGGETEVDGCGASTQSNSIREDARSLKESSEHSCSSSVIDEEAQARRSPTVVARLMGLDSMPAAAASPPKLNPMPSTVQQPLQTSSHDDLIGRSYVASLHKMPGSPIDRFKMEGLPPRCAKRTVSVAQCRLLSPIKNPNHVSNRNAADIMEAASRIIGSGFENISAHRGHDSVYTNAVLAYNTREIIGVQQRSQKLSEELRKHDASISSRPPTGKTLGGWSKSSESTSFRISQSNGCTPVCSKVKTGNRSSTAVQAMHSQGKEEIRKGGKKLETPSRNMESGMVKRRGSNQRKDNNQMAAGDSSNVSAPSSRKQNAMAIKHKANSNAATPSQQRSNSHQTNGAPRKVEAAGTLSRNATQGNRKVDLQSTNHANTRVHSAAKAIPRPRRLRDKRIYSDKSQPTDGIISDRSQRRVRHNIVIDEQSSFSTSKKKISTEIVSFTFTSPVDKSLHGSHIPNHLVGKQFMESLNTVQTSNNTSNQKPDAIDGDYLGVLLEQKLKELTSGVRSPYTKPTKALRIYAPQPLSEDTASACDTSSIASTDYDGESSQSFKDGRNILPGTDCAKMIGQSSQSAKYDNNAMELENIHLSPLSTWEASLSTETCSSTESWRSANGAKLFTSTEEATTSDSTHLNKFLEDDALSQYSDTASSITMATAEIPRSESSSSCHMDHGQEVEFIRQVLNAASPVSHIFSRLERFGNSEILDPRLLEELNGNNRLLVGEESKAYRLRQRLLFDCVNELLSVKCAYYFNAGYGSWFTGMAVLQNLSADDMHREMTSLKVAEEWMVDDLVYKEMSGPMGSWVDFKMESYQVGADITTELLSLLIGEMVADFLTG